MIYQFLIQDWLGDPDKPFEILVDSRSLFNMIRFLNVAGEVYTYSIVE